MFIHNPSTAPVTGFNWKKTIVNVPCGAVVEVPEEVGKAILITFGFLQEVAKAPEGVEVDVIEAVAEKVGLGPDDEEKDGPESPSEDVSEELSKEVPAEDENAGEGEKEGNTEESEIPANFMQLKKYAAEKGVKVDRHITKDEILMALENL